MTMIVAATPMETFGSPDTDIFQRLWENDLTACQGIDCNGTVEFARGDYVRDGFARSFVLVRSIVEEDGVKKTFIRFEFLGDSGDKYLIRVVFDQSADVVIVHQFMRYYKTGMGRIRKIVHPMQQALEGTEIPPFFLAFAVQLLARYDVKNIMPMADGVQVEANVNKKAKGILPDSVQVVLEEKNAQVAPVFITMKTDEEELFTFRIKNAEVNGHLRPFLIAIDKDIVIFSKWGITKNQAHFDQAGFLRDMNASPSFLSLIVCPPEICNKK